MIQTAAPPQRATTINSRLSLLPAKLLTWIHLVSVDQSEFVRTYFEAGLVTHASSAESKAQSRYMCFGVKVFYNCSPLLLYINLLDKNDVHQREN